MQCPLCGYECTEQETFCPQCGKQLTAATPTASSGMTLSSFVANLLREPLFLVICILMTVGAVIPFVQDGTLNVFSILFAIFFWLLYGSAQKGVGEARYLRCVSGTACAAKVVLWVAFGMLAATGVLIVLIGGALAGTETWKEAVTEMWGELLPELQDRLDAQTISNLHDFLFTDGTIVFAAIGMICLVAAAVYLVMAIGWSKIHRFVQSVYRSIQQEVWQPKKVRAAKDWVLAFGILSVLGGVSGIGALCKAAAWICLYIWLNKHLRADETLY